MKKIALLPILLSSLLTALTITPEALQKELSEATLIADIETLEIAATPDPTVFAKSKALVKILGTSPVQGPDSAAVKEQDLIHVEFMGGELNERGAFFSGLPRLYRGQRYHASLKKTGDSSWKVVGYEFGLKPLNGQRAYSRNRTDGSNGEGNGAYLFWDASFMPIPYFIAEPTFRNHPDFIAGIEKSFKTWRDLENIRVELVPMGCSRTKFNENDGLNNVILITDNWPFDTSAIAITRNFYVAGSTDRAGVILDSDILLNGVNHQFTMKNETSKHDIQNIVTHEVGHFLGLGHETAPQDPDATMYAVASTGETKKRTLAASDIAGITSAYKGAGEKLNNAGTTCQVSEENVGCRLGVKDRQTRFPFGFLAGIAFLVSQIFIGRLLCRVNES